MNCLSAPTVCLVVWLLLCCQRQLRVVSVVVVVIYCCRIFVRGASLTTSLLFMGGVGAFLQACKSRGADGQAKKTEK